jgi:hypothetical protein
MGEAPLKKAFNIGFERDTGFQAPPQEIINGNRGALSHKLPPYVLVILMQGNI